MPDRSAYEALGDLDVGFRAQKEFVEVRDSLDQRNNARRCCAWTSNGSSATADRRQPGRRNALLCPGTGAREQDANNSGATSCWAAGSDVGPSRRWNRLRYTRRSRATAIAKEKQRSDDLLHNILPEDVAATN